MAASDLAVIAKLDKMLILMNKPAKWQKGAEATELYDRNNLVIIDKKTKKPVMAYCLVGAVKAAGNGVQLYWELAWTIDVDTIRSEWGAFVRDTKDYSSDVIVSYNDENDTDYAMIKSVIRRTRDRIKRHGLLKLPRGTKAA
jgi:hypothetical protein